MSPMKVMPLFLTLVTSVVMMSGVARSAETQIKLAQAQTPQQLEEERKKKAQEQQHGQQQHQGQDQQKALEQQKALQQRAQEQQHQQQQKQAQEQQQKAQEQQRAQQQKLAQEQQQKALEQQRAQQQKQAQEQQQKALEQQKLQQQQRLAQEQQQKALELQKAQQQKGFEQKKQQEDAHRAQEQHLGQQPAVGGQGKLATPGAPLGQPSNVGQAGKGNPPIGQANAQQQELLKQQAAQQKALEDARLHHDQAKIQQLQQQQRSTEQQLHQELQKAGFQQQQAQQQQSILRHELSAPEQKEKAEREAHRLDRERLVAKQQQMAAAERSQAAINDRLRLQNERLRAISSERKQSVDRNGQTVITEPGNRTIIQTNNQIFIRHDETVNFNLYGGRVQSSRGPGGNTISTIVRPDGIRLEVEVDSYGRPLRRVRVFPDGRRFVLFENRPIEAGVGFALGSFVVDLAPPRLSIPREQYIVDADVASEDDIYGALQAPPVEQLDRGYSLDEILASVRLRERMRSVSLDSINFEFGSWEVGPEQAAMLESVAAVMRDITTQNPGEVFLIEGHTDAVGSVVDNLSLSDRRAQAVAEVLSQQFNIPRENLVTQGYGKQFLLIPTDEPERRNRRVVVRRITPLLQGDSDRYSSGYGQRDGYRR